MKSFMVLHNVALETPEGPVTLRQGQVIRLATTEAVLLSEAGKIAEICYWQDRVIPDCQKPCYHSDRSGNVSECPHFRAYWNVRISEINAKAVIPGL